MIYMNWNEVDDVMIITGWRLMGWYGRDHCIDVFVLLFVYLGHPKGEVFWLTCVACESFSHNFRLCRMVTPAVVLTLQFQ